MMQCLKSLMLLLSIRCWKEKLVMMQYHWSLLHLLDVVIVLLVLTQAVVYMTKLYG